MAATSGVDDSFDLLGVGTLRGVGVDILPGDFLGVNAKGAVRSPSQVGFIISPWRFAELARSLEKVLLVGVSNCLSPLQYIVPFLWAPGRRDLT
jgi:hypothetical protein